MAAKSLFGKMAGAVTLVARQPRWLLPNGNKLARGGCTSAVFLASPAADALMSQEVSGMPVQVADPYGRLGPGFEPRPAVTHSGLLLDECRSAPPESLFSSPHR